MLCISVSQGFVRSFVRSGGGACTLPCQVGSSTLVLCVRVPNSVGTSWFLCALAPVVLLVAFCHLSLDDKNYMRNLSRLEERLVLSINCLEGVLGARVSPRLLFHVGW